MIDYFIVFFSLVLIYLKCILLFICTGNLNHFYSNNLTFAIFDYYQDNSFHDIIITQSQQQFSLIKMQKLVVKFFQKLTVLLLYRDVPELRY